MRSVTYCLYGVADRDPDELVCMFFQTIEDRKEFEEALPGNYRYLTLQGINYDDFTPVHADA